MRNRLFTVGLIILLAGALASAGMAQTRMQRAGGPAACYPSCRQCRYRYAGRHGYCCQLDARAGDAIDQIAVECW